MKNCEVIGVGTELLLGQIANTDAQHVSILLKDLGLNVFYHTVVGDNKDRILSSLREDLGLPTMI